MELNLPALYTKAVHLNESMSDIALKGERIRGAKRYKDLTLRETSAFLRDFSSLSDSKTFSEKELSQMLGNTCLETGSFLFSAGAPTNVWRSWCRVTGKLFYLAQDFSYSMQLLAISRASIHSKLATVLSSAVLGSYREQAIQSIIFRPMNPHHPTLSPMHPLDNDYKSIIDAWGQNDEVVLVHPITEIVRFWLNETSYGRFEPGVFPVFEPEINSTVSALVVQSFNLEFQDIKVKRFLRAGLE